MARTNKTKTRKGRLRRQPRLEQRVKELQGRSARPADLLNLAHDSVILMDWNYTITFWNRGAERRYGWSPNETCGHAMPTLLQTQFPRPLEEIQAELLRAGFWQGVLSHVTRAGKRISVESRWSLQRGAKGEPVAILDIHNDMTGHGSGFLAQMEVDGRAKHLASFPELNPNPVLEVDVAGSITFANPAAHQMLERLGLDSANVKALLPADIDGILREWDKQRTLSVDREIRLNGSVFGETIALVPELRVARIYGYDITERKNTEQALVRSNSTLAQVLDSIQDDFYVLDRDWIFVYASRRFTSRIGKEPVDFVGNCIWEMFPKHVGSVLYENFHAAMDKREIRRFEVGGQYTDAWYAMTCFPSAEGITVLGTDITERKRAEESLRDSRSRLQALVETTSDFIWEMDARGVYTYCSPQLRTLWGFDPQEMVGKTPFDLLAAKDREQAIRTFSGLAESKTPFRNIQVRSIDALGSCKFLEISGVPFCDATGELKGYRGITRDITERKRAEDELRQRTEELQAIMEAVPTAVFITRDPDARMITGNRAARALVELPASANLSKSAPEEERPTGWQEMRNGLPIAPDDLPMQQAARGIEVRDSEMDLVFRDGTVKSIVSNATPLRDENGHPQGGIAVLIDVTQRKQVEESLREALQRIQNLNQALEQRAGELEVANEELERLATSLALDLRSPLVSLRGISRVLAQDYHAQLPPQAQPLFRLIQANADEMEELTQGLLQLMRVTRQTLRKQELEPEEIVGAVWAELQLEREGRHVELIVGDLPSCQADPLLLKRVWTNLLSNALKATRNKELAHIEIGARAEGKRSIYFVKDDGMGFDMSYAGSIFRAFQRYHHPEDWAGSGVGLAIVDSIIRRHGGRVWAEGVVNEGATFYFEV